MWVNPRLTLHVAIYLSIIQFFSFGVIYLYIYSHIYRQVGAIYMWVNRRQTLHVATGLSNIHFVFLLIHLFMYSFICLGAICMCVNRRQTLHAAICL